MVKPTPIDAAALAPDPALIDLPEVDEAGLLLAERIRCAELRLRAVEELLDVGMDLTRNLRERVRRGQSEAPAKGGAPELAPPDYAGAFAKLSRAVRLTLDMHARFDDALSALRLGKAAAVKERRERRAQAAEQAEDETLDRLRDDIATQVRVAIAREAESERDHDDLILALYERLENDAAYDELADRPFRDIVEQLCKELCLTPDWSGWTEEGWPVPLPIGAAARPVFSPFHRPSPRPLLKVTVDEQPHGGRIFELADPP
jgi:hypothetical protein